MKRLLMISVLALGAHGAHAQQTVTLRTTPEHYADRWVANGHLWVRSEGYLADAHGRLTPQYRHDVDAGPISCRR